MSNDYEKERLKKGLLSNLKYDLPAGLVVFLVAVPLCLGIASGSRTALFGAESPLQTPLFSGIIAGMIGGLVIPLISRSPLSVSGPAAGLIAIVITAVGELGGFQVFLLAVFLSGLIQVVLGLVRAGNLAYFFPNSVIRGMLAAIGLTLILKQIPHALGHDEDFEGEMAFLQADGENTFSEILNSLSHISVGALIISVVSIGILLLWDNVAALKRLRFLPGALVVVVVGAVINYVYRAFGSGLQLENTEEVKHLVNLPVFSSFKEFLGAFQLPDWSQVMNPQVWVTAFTLAIVASMESLLSVEAVDRIDPFKRESPLSRELVAQGVGNALAGLIGGLPVTAVIVRSSANVNAGGRTRASAIIHGLLLLISVIFLASFLNLIPFAALAGILLIVGYKLADPKLFFKMYRQGWDQFIPFATTVIVVLLTNLLVGIGVGLVVGIFFVLKTNYHSSVMLKEEGSEFIFRFKKDVSFLNKAKITKCLQRVPLGANVVIDMSAIEFIDHDVKEMLMEFGEGAPLRNITVVWKGAENILGQHPERVS